MGFCIGGKWCRRQKCNQRCKSWFGLQPDLERACINACKGNTSLAKDDFLCSGKYVDEQVIMGAYGYDPCAATGVDIEDYLDPLDTQAENQERLQSLMPLFILLALIIGLGVWYLIKRK